MIVPLVGVGTDVHAYAADRPCWVAGLQWEGVPGLVGHSDGDVLLHAVMDAVLGAAGLGDLGSHFPSDDPRYKDADSRELLRRIGSEVREAGYSIVSLDATIVAQAPRLDSHVAAMKSAIARGLQLTLESVSLKAKTSDGIGAIGAGEAIAAIAVALATK